MSWQKENKGQVYHYLNHKNIALTFIKVECKLSYVPIYKLNFTDNWNEVTCKKCLKKKEKK